MSRFFSFLKRGKSSSNISAKEPPDDSDKNPSNVDKNRLSMPVADFYQEPKRCSSEGDFDSLLDNGSFGNISVDNEDENVKCSLSSEYLPDIERKNSSEVCESSCARSVDDFVDEALHELEEDCIDNDGTKESTATQCNVEIVFNTFSDSDSSDIYDLEIIPADLEDDNHLVDFHIKSTQTGSEQNNTLGNSDLDNSCTDQDSLLNNSDRHPNFDVTESPDQEKKDLITEVVVAGESRDSSLEIEDNFINIDSQNIFVNVNNEVRITVPLSPDQAKDLLRTDSSNLLSKSTSEVFSNQSSIDSQLVTQVVSTGESWNDSPGEKEIKNSDNLSNLELGCDELNFSDSSNIQVIPVGISNSIPCFDNGITFTNSNHSILLKIDPTDDQYYDSTDYGPLPESGISRNSNSSSSSEYVSLPSNDSKDSSEDQKLSIENLTTHFGSSEGDEYSKSERKIDSNMEEVAGDQILGLDFVDTDSNQFSQPQTESNMDQVKSFEIKHSSQISVTEPQQETLPEDVLQSDKSHINHHSPDCESSDMLIELMSTKSQYNDNDRIVDCPEISKRTSDTTVSDCVVLSPENKTVTRLLSTDESNFYKLVNADHEEAEARLAQRRAARAEAREMRLREIERQQKEQGNDDDDDAAPLTPVSNPGLSSTPESMSRTPSVPRSRASLPSNCISRRSSEDSLPDDNLSSTAKELKTELKEMQEKFRSAMISNAQLDNEKATLTYEVELMKDKCGELEEAHTQLTKEHRRKCSEVEQLKKITTKLREEVKILRRMLQERDELIQEYGLVVVGEEENGDASFDDIDDPERLDEAVIDLSPRKIGVRKALLSQEASELLQNGAAKGSLDVRLRKYAQEKDDLEDEVQRLRLELDEQMSRRRQENGLDHEKQKEASKSINEYKFRVQKSEAEVSMLQANVARLESLAARYKASTEELEKSEEELKQEKRKLQRELRESQNRLEELEVTTNHLQKRFDKLKTARSALLKDLSLDPPS